jgi:hypothetical protein
VPNDAPRASTVLTFCGWDKHELIAVDSSAKCVVNTLRIDFTMKKVTISTALKGETKDEACKESKATTAFLGGVDNEVKKMTQPKK